MSVRRVLLTGGARSGKSLMAERLVGSAPRVTYVATATADATDPEWQTRIARHRERRPAAWTTVETDDLLPLINAANPQSPVLIDCLTLWLTRQMDAADAWTTPLAAEPRVITCIDALARAVATCPGGLILVTNEVGSGIVPAQQGTRLFRDLLGRLNATVAAHCDDVFLVVAGHAVRLERQPA